MPLSLSGSHTPKISNLKLNRNGGRVLFRPTLVETLVYRLNEYKL